MLVLIELNELLWSQWRRDYDYSSYSYSLYLFI